jgi:hypothetical protein
MAQCPVCDQPLLSCIRKHQQYLFCSHCRGEMPHFTAPQVLPRSHQGVDQGGNNHPTRQTHADDGALIQHTLHRNTALVEID